MTAFFCDNLRRYLEGRPLVNLVDKSLGFPEPPPDPQQPAAGAATSKDRRQP